MTEEAEVMAEDASVWPRVAFVVLGGLAFLAVLLILGTLLEP